MKHTSNEIMFLTFESLTWVIGGIAISHPTPAQLAAMRPGVDGARLAPPRSKPDQTGEIHCPFSVVLTYQPGRSYQRRSRAAVNAGGDTKTSRYRPAHLC